MKNKIFILLALSFIVMLRLVAASSDNIDVTEVSPTSLVPGEQTDLTFKVENTGGTDINNVVFSWEEKTGSILPVGSSNTKSINYLSQGDTESFDFNALTSSSATPGLYELTFTIKFDNENGTQTTETSNAGIIVGGQTDFDVSVSDSSSTGTILSIANVGKNPADSVTVTIPEQSDFKIAGSSSSIIGSLAKGDYSVASFQIESLSRSSSALNVEIQYTDTTGERQTLTKTVEIPYTTSSVASTSSKISTTGYAVSNNRSNNSLLVIGFVISMVLTIGVIILIVKKSRNKNETE